MYYIIKIIKKIVIAIALLTIVEGVFAQSELSENNEKEELKKSLDFDNWPGKTTDVRNGINLSNLKIPSLADTHEIEPKYPFFISKKDNGELFVRYRSQWQLTRSDFLEITLSFYKSGTEAHENMINHYMLTPLPLEVRKKSRDKYPVAGDISFYNGRLFIRNNIIVKIYAEGKLIPRIEKIATTIDSLLLNQQIAQSYEDATPKIKKDGDNIIVIEP